MEIVDPCLKSFAAGGGEGHDLEFGVEVQGIGAGLGHRKVEVGQEVGLGDDKDLGADEGLGVFGRFVRAFGHRNQDYPLMLAQVEGGRANQVADIFNKEQVDRITARLFFQQMQSPVDLGRIQMAGPSGGDLHHRHPLGPDPLGITVSLDIPLNYPDSDLALQSFNGFFQQGGLARAWAGDHVDGYDPHGLKVGAVFCGDGIIGCQQALVDLDDFRAMVVTMAVTMLVGMTVFMVMIMVVVGGKIAAAGITHGGTFLVRIIDKKSKITRS